MRRAFLLAVVALVPACGDDGGSTIDAGPVLLEGEYLSWDSTDANFCGVLGATFTDHDNPAVTESTPPNGRLNLMMGAGESRLDITPPPEASECAQGTFSTPGILIIKPEFVAAGVEYSIRSFIDTRRDSFYTELGVTFDATKAAVFVNVHGSSAPSIDADHDATGAYDGTTWAAGNNGEYVFFPNVDASSGSTTLAGQTLPLVAGTITYAATN